MQVHALTGILLVAFLASSGCADKNDGPTAEELAHMISGSRGAISGIVLDQHNRTMNELNVKLFLTATNEKYGEVETGFNGRFYFQKLFPTQYRVSVDLKDWTDCTVNVKANQFTNLTVRQPVYPAYPKSC